MRTLKTYQYSQDCIKLIEEHEGFRSQAYLCPAKKWTIGYGTTVYPTGIRVMPDDRCTKGQAEVYLMNDLLKRGAAISALITADISQNQFDALLSFSYNVGIGNFQASTLLRKVNANPKDGSISLEFMRWVFGGDGSHNGIDDDGDGKIDEPGEKLKLPGLIHRAADQSKLYFKAA